MGGRLSPVFALVSGLSYLLVGILQILSSFGLIAPIMGFSDIVGGFLLIIIASVFLSGVKPLLEKDQEGFAFLTVGFILAGIMFGLQLLVILTNSLGWILGFQNWLSWNIMNDLTPSLWMFFILLIMAGLLWVEGSLREKTQGAKRGVRK